MEQYETRTPPSLNQSTQEKASLAQSLREALSAVQEIYPLVELEHTPLSIEGIEERCTEVYGAEVAHLLIVILRSLPHAIIDNARQTIPSKQAEQMASQMQLEMLEVARFLLNEMPKYPADLPNQVQSSSQTPGCITGARGIIISVIYAGIMSTPSRLDLTLKERWRSLSTEHFLDNYLTALPLGALLTDTHDSEIGERKILVKTVRSAIKTRLFIEEAKPFPSSERINWRNPNGDRLGAKIILSGRDINNCLYLLGDNLESGVALLVHSISILRIYQRNQQPDGAAVSPNSIIFQEASRSLFQLRRLSIALFNLEITSDHLADEAFRVLNPTLFREAFIARDSVECLRIGPDKVSISLEDNVSEAVCWSQAIFLTQLLERGRIQAQTCPHQYFPIYVSARNKSVWSSYLKIWGIEKGVFPPKGACTKEVLCFLIAEYLRTGQPCSTDILDHYTGDIAGTVIGLRFPEQENIPAEEQSAIDFVSVAEDIRNTFEETGVKVIGFHTKYLDRVKYPNYCAIHMWVALPCIDGKYSLLEVRIMPEEFLGIYQAQHINHNRRKEGFPSGRDLEATTVTMFSAQAGFSPVKRSLLGDGPGIPETTVVLNGKGLDMNYPGPQMDLITGTLYGGTVADTLYAALFRKKTDSLQSLYPEPTSLTRSLLRLGPIKEPFPRDILQEEYRLLGVLAYHLYATLGAPNGNWATRTSRGIPSPRDRIILSPKHMALIPQIIPYSCMHLGSNFPSFGSPLEIRVSISLRSLLEEIAAWSPYFTHITQETAIGLCQNLADYCSDQGNRWILDLLQDLIVKNLVKVAPQVSSTILKAKLAPQDLNVVLQHLSKATRRRLVAAIKEYFYEEDPKRRVITDDLQAQISKRLAEFGDTSDQAVLIILDLAQRSVQRTKGVKEGLLRDTAIASLIIIASAAGPNLESLIIRYLSSQIRLDKLTPERLLNISKRISLANGGNHTFGLPPQSWVDRTIILLKKVHPEFSDQYVALK
ncbi:MAG: hypothetical protein ABIE03_03310 [Patescibacteria group bacterium]|nr:hypothetical protein [Patescibacteria group bacterium]